MGQRKKSQAAKIHDQRNGDVGHPRAVIDKGGHEKDDDSDRKPDDLAPPHFRQVNLLPHVGRAVNSHYAEN
jgi:hypothetical protein